MRRISEWNSAEKGTVLGFLIGANLVVLSYMFNYQFNLKFCLGFVGYSKVCIRYVALLPFVFAIVGLFIASIFGEREN